MICLFRLGRSDRIGTGFGGRVLPALLTIYAIAIITPDIFRIGHPLGSFGLNSNGDGLIHDVQGPFAAETELPAWQAGICPGDRLDAAMRCIPVNTELCASMLALWGGLNYVLPDRKATLLLSATGDRPRASGDTDGAAPATRAGSGFRTAARSDRRHHVRYSAPRGWCGPCWAA